MYLYKMITDTDYVLQPKENGIFNKKIIEDSLWHYLESFNENSDIKIDYTILYELAYGNSNEYVKDCFDEILNKSKKLDEKIKKVFNIRKKEQVYKNVDFKEEISESIINHLTKSSYVNTEWITLSSDIKNVLNGYNDTNIHQVALVNSNINRYLDKDTLAIDLSHSYPIEVNKLLKKDDSSMELYKYSNDRKEVLYYNHIPSDKIYILNPLIIDLLCNDMIDLRTLNGLSNLNRFTLTCLSMISDKLSNDYLVTELYINNKNINSLVSDSLSYEDLLEFKRKALEVLNSQKTKNIKIIKKDFILPEEIDKHR